MPPKCLFYYRHFIVRISGCQLGKRHTIQVAGQHNGVNAERLTEILLMLPPDAISGCNAVIPFDDEYAGVAVPVDDERGTSRPTDRASDMQI